jgi:predicted helicase
MNSLDREYVLNELRALKSELRDRYKVSKIGIFGSVARNEATERRDRLDDEEYIVRLIKQVITVSLETVKLVLSQ